MVQVQITATNRRVSDFADDISRLRDGGYWDFLDADVFVAMPDERKHGLIGPVVGLVGGGGGPVSHDCCF